MVDNATAYVVAARAGLRVKHGTQARFEVLSGRRKLEDRLVPAELLGGALTVASVMYNAATMSGGVSWWHPGTGEPIDRPRVRIRFRSSDVLSGDQQCDCSVCRKEGVQQ